MFFDFIFFIYSIIYLPYLICSGRLYKDYQIRFGFFPLSVKSQMADCCALWVHAVSVGEVMVAMSLIDKIKQQWPNQNIVLTVTTKTGYQLATEKLKGKVLVLPSPLDFR